MVFYNSYLKRLWVPNELFFCVHATGVGCEKRIGFRAILFFICRMYIFLDFFDTWHKKIKKIYVKANPSWNNNFSAVKHHSPFNYTEEESLSHPVHLERKLLSQVEINGLLYIEAASSFASLSLLFQNADSDGFVAHSSFLYFCCLVE